MIDFSLFLNLVPRAFRGALSNSYKLTTLIQKNYNIQKNNGDNGIPLLPYQILRGSAKARGG